VIHLDTSFLIRALAPGNAEDATLRRWLDARAPLAMSTVAWTEFLCGPLEPADAGLARGLLRAVVPYGLAEAAVAARLYNDGGRRRGSLADCMVAACAVTADAELATSNPRDFARLGVRLAAA